jgi:threonine dehydrogenase-like Zn-dependent dehydrogenase
LRAVVWHGPHDVRVERVDDPHILNPRDAIVRVTRTAIGGSDLHAFHGLLPTMREGDILGREFVGEVVEVGPAVASLAVGDRVAVPFAIACGRCFFCVRGKESLCDNSNPNAALAEAVYGHAPSGLFGSSHLRGGYAGGQAEHVRVPYADVGPFRLPEGLRDEQAVLLTEDFPAAWQAVESCGVEPGDVVAVWGLGPVGLLAAKSALLQGAARVLAIDEVPERLRMARRVEATAVDPGGSDLQEAIRDLTAGRGPDACIDAAALEGQAPALPDAIRACRKGGTVCVAGVHGVPLDHVPLRTAFEKGLTLRTGPPHVRRSFTPLAQMVLEGVFDPALVVTHQAALADAPAAYAVCAARLEGCVKVVLSAE